MMTIPTTMMMSSDDLDNTGPDPLEVSAKGAALRKRHAALANVLKKHGRADARSQKAMDAVS